MNKQRKGTFLLLGAAMIWGMGLVAQSAGMDYMGPFGFTTLRCALGAIAIIPMILIFDSKKTAEEKAIERKPENRKYLWKCSIILGIVVAAIMIIQQIGLPYTTVGKSGFITALYILFTPLFGIFIGRKIGKSVWVAVGIALVGFYLLSLTEGIGNINFGDIMMLIVALLCTAQMYIIEKFVNNVDPLKFSCLQFVVVAVLCVIPSFVLEDMSWETIKSCAVPILYSGLAASAGGYTLQMLGQQYVEPSRASLLMSMESVFAMLAALIIFGEVLNVQEYVGCFLLFIAILISQKAFPFNKLFKDEELAINETASTSDDVAATDINELIDKEKVD